MNLLNNYYKVVNILGSGSYGQVFEAVDRKTGQLVAIKCILKSTYPKSRLVGFVKGDEDNNGQNIPIETYILGKLKHRNIVRFISSLEDENYYYLITELFGSKWNRPIESGYDAKVISPKPTDLFECMEENDSFNEQSIIKIISQLCNVVIYLMGLDLFHLDLKDENILIDHDLNIKLIDFGSIHYLPRSKINQGESLKNCYGTLDYAAPEILLGRGYNPEETEVWSLGIILYKLMHGNLPFSNIKDIITPKQLVLPGSSAFYYSATLQDLLRSMLEKDGSKRIRMKRLSLILHKLS
jgi:serine/threonine protein kinase